MNSPNTKINKNCQNFLDFQIIFFRKISKLPIYNMLILLNVEKYYFTYVGKQQIMGGGVGLKI